MERNEYSVTIGADIRSFLFYSLIYQPSLFPEAFTMKKLLWLIPLIPLLVYILAYPSIGGNPEGKHLNRIEKSPQYDASEQQFQNPTATPLYTGKRSWFEMIIDFYLNGEERRPEKKLPEDRSSLSALATKSNEVRFIWFGHSTILLEIDGKRILIDPIFSNYASPIPGIAKRFQPPLFDIDEIDNIDVVLISHDHYDHLDHKTITKLKGRDIQYIVPLGVGAHLRYWGIDDKRVIELDWWEETVIKDLRFTATPSQHFSGRGIFNGNGTLWASWAVKGNDQNVYFGGDSGYSEHYKNIGDRLGPFDLTFLENGAYNKDWKFVHQLPEEGVQASIDLKGKAMVPIHWGMFDLAMHSWYEPVQRATEEAERKGVRIIAPKLGQLVSTREEHIQEAWWEPLIQKLIP